jgi:alkanesulfonate monooxygenase SsuD/methylene tetrahydromethanopterin reductase-like flavin-dependent oxidoreductase (luciferase family)
VDTLGLDDARRTAWLAAARTAQMPAVVVLLDTPPETCRARNRERDRPVPAQVITGQLRAATAVGPTLDLEGWDLVHRVSDDGRDADGAPGRSQASTAPGPERRTSQGLRFLLQVGRFPWGEDPSTWLSDVALAADAAGFAGLALMDHLIQVPQVGRAWEPIPEPWVTLGLLSGLDTRLELGTLVTPVTFRPAGVVAKAAATLDALSGGRAFVGIGAGWWEREHAAYGVPFPATRDRVDEVERAIATMRALWAPGTKPSGDLPETTCYPRPVHNIPVVVGGSGRRMLAIGARVADAVNVRTPLVDRALAAVEGTGTRVTVLDLPTVGRDREDTWARVERLRGTTRAAAYAERTWAGTPAEQRDRYGALADRGVDTVFLAVADLDGVDDVERLAPLLR